MSAPYTIREFKATSGNECRLKVYPIQPNGTWPIDCSWEEIPTDADIHECNAWAAEDLGPETAKRAGPELKELTSMYIEDAHMRERLIRSVLAGSN